MTWEQLKEINKADFATIGHHSHTHDYLIDKSNNVFVADIEKANKIFLEKIGYIPSLFSYPFGEYSKFMKDYISKNFYYLLDSILVLLTIIKKNLNYHDSLLMKIMVR